MSFERDTITTAGRAAEVIGLAAIVGGNLFARTGMHPALREVSDPAERGKVLNTAWSRYGTIESLSLAALITGWAASRPREAESRNLSERERALGVAKDAAVAGVALTGVAAGILGMRFSGMEPEGAVPLEDGNKAGESASPNESRAKRRLNLLGAVHLASALTLVGVNAALAQAGATQDTGRQRCSFCSRSIPRRRR